MNYDISYYIIYIYIYALTYIYICYIFYHKINVVLLKKKLGSNVDSVGDADNVITARRIQRWGVPRRGCGAAHKVESALV